MSTYFARCFSTENQDSFSVDKVFFLCWATKKKNGWKLFVHLGYFSISSLDGKNQDENYWHTFSFPEKFISIRYYCNCYCCHQSSFFRTACLLLVSENGRRGESKWRTDGTTFNGIFDENDFHSNLIWPNYENYENCFLLQFSVRITATEHLYRCICRTSTTQSRLIFHFVTFFRVFHEYLCAS